MLPGRNFGSTQYAKAGFLLRDRKSQPSSCTWRITCCVWGRQSQRKSLASFVYGFHQLMAEYYRGQPAEIRALMPDRAAASLYFLYPFDVLERACEADPCAENFQRWLRFAVEGSPPRCDYVRGTVERGPASRHPAVIALDAIRGEAKRTAEGFQADGAGRTDRRFECRGRRARLRLLVSMAVRHLRGKKPRLAEKELRDIEALPQAQQGDRPAFLAALRHAWCFFDSPEKAAAAHAEAVRLLGEPITAYLLLLQVEQWCKLPSPRSANRHSPRRHCSQRSEGYARLATTSA